MIGSLVGIVLYQQNANPVQTGGNEIPDHLVKAISIAAQGHGAR